MSLIGNNHDINVSLHLSHDRQRVTQKRPQTLVYVLMPFHNNMTSYHHSTKYYMQITRLTKSNVQHYFRKLSTYSIKHATPQYSLTTGC